MNQMTTLLDSLVKDASKRMAPFHQFLHSKENKQLDSMLGLLEQKTTLKREHMAYGVISGIAVYFILGSFASILCNIVGFIYPAYRSVKAIRSQNKEDDTQWLMYWVVFACFSVFDISFFSAMPFYWLVKVSFLVYLSSFRGASVIYTRIVDPTISRFEGYFAKKVEHAKEH